MFQLLYRFHNFLNSKLKKDTSFQEQRERGENSHKTLAVGKKMDKTTYKSRESSVLCQPWRKTSSTLIYTFRSQKARTWWHQMPLETGVRKCSAVCSRRSWSPRYQFPFHRTDGPGYPPSEEVKGKTQQSSFSLREINR